MTSNLRSELVLLESVSDASVRNALALRLAETKRPEVLAVLLKLIDRPDLADARATLVHCLGFYDYSAYFELLVNLVAQGNWEVAHEAHGLLSSIDNLSGDEVSHGFELIERLMREDIPDDWRRELLRDLSSMFE